MWPWRSLVPTIEIVTGGWWPGGAASLAACVGGATHNAAPTKSALGYDGGMRTLRWVLSTLVMTAAACGGGKGTPHMSGTGGLSGTGGSGNRFGKTYQQQ